MSLELKIKSKHLGEEARIIKFEQRKLQKQIDWLRRHQKPVDKKLIEQRDSLYHHRIWDVRNENRSTFLARAYIEGRPYKTVEKKCDEGFLRFHIVPRVTKMIMKYYTTDIDLKTVAEWMGLKY